MSTVYIRATEKAVLVCEIESESELNSCLQHSSWPFLQREIYETQEMTLTEGKILDMVEYAKKNKKEFWCVEEKHWGQEDLNRGASSLHTIQAVWHEFNQTR